MEESKIKSSINFIFDLSVSSVEFVTFDELDGPFLFSFFCILVCTALLYYWTQWRWKASPFLAWDGAPMPCLPGAVNKG